MSSRVLTPGLTVSEDLRVRKVRELPVAGEITAAVGAKVAGSDIVGRASLPGDLAIVRVPEQLGITADEALAALKIAEGQPVSRDQLLAEHSGLFGLFRSRCTAPEAGMIEFIARRTGHIGIRLPPRQVVLEAYLTGSVVDVQPGKALTIETRAALVQGIIGVGGERRGQLKMLGVEADTQLRPEHIPEECSECVLVGGCSPSAAALATASARGAKALVTGSIDDRALAAYLGYDLGIALTGDEQLSMTLIITEGFGHIPFSRRPLDLLRSLEGRGAAVNGATQVRAGAVRPEIIVAHTAPQTAAPVRSVDGELTVGSRVRLIRVPYFGLFATVTELPHSPERLPTGSLARVLRVRLDDGATATVPRANIELI